MIVVNYLRFLLTLYMVQRPSVCDGSCSPVLSSAGNLDHDRATKFPVSPVPILGVTVFNDMLPIHVLVEKSTNYYNNKIRVILHKFIS